MAIDESVYTGQRANLLSQYTSDAAMNAYRKYLAQLQGSRQIQALKEKPFGAAKEVPRLTSSYARRGLKGRGIKSGIYSRALSDYGKAYTEALGRAQTDYEQQLRGFDLTEKGLESAYQRGLQDVEIQKARDIAADALAVLQATQ
jgi:hypothetical protein